MARKWLFGDLRGGRPGGGTPPGLPPRQALESHENDRGMENIVFYGASDLAEIAYLSLQETSLRLKTIVSKSKNGETFLGIKIEDPKVLDKTRYDIILITSIGMHNELIADLLKRGIERKKIVTL